MFKVQNLRSGCIRSYSSSIRCQGNFGFSSDHMSSRRSQRLVEIVQGLGAIGDINHVFRLRIRCRDAHEGTQVGPTGNKFLDLVQRIYVLGSINV